MFSRFNKALNDRRAGLKREEGFTLIELLVVVIIIGILAAIAVPIYLGVQQSSKDAAVNTDVTNGKIAAIAYQTDNPAAVRPALDNATLGSYGFTTSTNTASLAWSGAATNWPKFCIVGTGTTGTKFWVTDSTGVVKATAAPSGC